VQPLEHLQWRFYTNRIERVADDSGQLFLLRDFVGMVTIHESRQFIRLRSLTSKLGAEGEQK
jgi:hypothetical protein